jgi:hypothetical protein
VELPALDTKVALVALPCGQPLPEKDKDAMVMFGVVAS